MIRILTFSLLFILGSCHAQDKGQEDESKISGVEIERPTNQQFNDYWYQGKAEMNRFNIQQARYGQLRKGDAVMIFVTEDFLTESQVKKEGQTDEQAASVLKLNYVKDFTTGIYDYNMMTSIFAPVDRREFPHALKVTTASQEWCGHTYLQLNNRGDNYQMKGYSYFMDEGDQKKAISKNWLEDELWTMIRLAPFQLPLGTIEVIPSTMYARLMHKPIQPFAAEASLGNYEGKEFPGKNLLVYTLDYPDLNRTLKIIFEKGFPHKIAGWKETYKSGFGKGKKILTSKGIRTHLTKRAYWKENQKKHRKLRKELGVE